MKKEFSFYEFVGVIAPGSVLLIILVQLFPDSLKFFDAKNLSLGGLGVFVIISYVIGHLIQSFGNLIENIWWKMFGGWPTIWIIQNGKCKYLSEEQLAVIPGKISNILKLEMKKNLTEYDLKQWGGITRQIYAAVKQAGASERIDIFNGNYGLFRGLASSFALGLAILTTKTGFSNHEFQLLISAFFLMAMARMHRFAKYYARELYVQFIQLRE